jgi:hypothetical protein
MSRKGEPYTQEEFERIKQLYAEGYSASLILEKIDRAVECPEGTPFRQQYEHAWLVQMQKRLNLPKRGAGFVGIRRGMRGTGQWVERLKERKKKILRILDNLENHKLRLLKELREIDKVTEGNSGKE